MLVATNPFLFAGTAFTYLVLGFGGLGLRKAVPYACFFLAGIAVAKFQWHIAFDEDRSGLVQYYFESLLLVPFASFIGLLFSVRYLPVDRLLTLIIGMTVLLGLMQFLSETTVIPAIALNVYARVYAITAMSFPFVSLGWNHYVQRPKVASRLGAALRGRPPRPRAGARPVLRRGCARRLAPR
jgi:hypothetical protein